MLLPLLPLAAALLFPLVFRYQNEAFVPEESLSNSPAVQLTWRWARNFVVPQNLCPWAAASVGTPGAVSIYYCNDDDESSFEELVLAVARHWKCNDPSTSIALCVTTTASWEFVDFCDWFYEFEEEERDLEVALAPFHPYWEYQGDAKTSVEKQTPFPTVSLVSQQAIDQAGEGVTDKIAQHNYEHLQTQSLQHWKDVYRHALLQD